MAESGIKENGFVVIMVKAPPAAAPAPAPQAADKKPEEKKPEEKKPAPAPAPAKADDGGAQPMDTTPDTTAAAIVIARRLSALSVHTAFEHRADAMTHSTRSPSDAHRSSSVRSLVDSARSR